MVVIEVSLLRLIDLIDFFINFLYLKGLVECD